VARTAAVPARFGIESFEYTNISPTIHGGGEVPPCGIIRSREPRQPGNG
jgi:hypothetical protein